MIEYIKEFSKELLQRIGEEKIHVVSHFDTDGITSAAIFSKTLERLGKQFSMKILKQLNEEEIKLFPKDKLIIILDLGSGSLDELSKLPNEIFIIDHHEIKKENMPPNLTIFNPHLRDLENFCSAELTYLVSREISEENKNLAHLSILGMIGDVMEKDINKIRDQIIKESSVNIKKGLLIYPSTRPLDRTLEYSSRPFIPGVTGNSEGAYNLLLEAGIGRQGKKFKSLIDLNEREMKDLTTGVMLRMSSKEVHEHVGNLYLIKLFNKIEDAREISAMINACSRMGEPQIALLFCLGNSIARKKAERVHIKYRQQIISGLKFVENTDKIEGREFILINAQDNIKDTIIGTIASIISFSSTYPKGTIIIGMANNGNYIKISSRVVGRKSDRNLKKLLESIVQTLGRGDYGGHKNAAGCTIHKEDEKKFIELIKKQLEFEMIKV
jgi:RecJ-like exonuclease